MWKPVLFGSVAEGVVRHAQCPVLAVPAAEEESSSD
jgi:nucleotide-binding universal stress UspA family protein